MPGQAAKRKRHDLDGADQVSLPSLLFPAPLFLPSIFSIALTCNGHANHTLRQSPKILFKFTVADPMYRSQSGSLVLLAVVTHGDAGFAFEVLP